jgi:hypothetical protein
MKDHVAPVSWLQPVAQCGLHCFRKEAAISARLAAFRICVDTYPTLRAAHRLPVERQAAYCVANTG